MAHRLNPIDPKTYPHLYRAVERLSRRIDEANVNGNQEAWLEGCHLLLEIQSDNIEGLAERCRAYRAAGDFPKAQVDFDKATLLVKAWQGAHPVANPSLNAQEVEALVADRFPGYWVLVGIEAEME